MAEDTMATELIPPMGEEGVGYRIFQILDQIMQDKNDLGLPAKWTRNYELSRNKHWRSSTAKATLVSANLMFSHRLRCVNMLTDNNPTFNITQLGDPEHTDEDVYDKLLHAAEHWWHEQEQQHVLERSVTNGETYGCTIEKLMFNQDLDAPMGEVETEVIDPFHFGFYPVKCQDVSKAEAVLHYRPMSVREARRDWPEMAEFIRADSEILKELGDERREVQGGRAGQPKGYFSTVSGVVKNMLNIAGESVSESEETLVVEVWVKDNTVDEIGDMIYPGGIRSIITCSGGKVVLSDRANPSINPELPIEQAQHTYLWDRFPFTLTHSITDTVNRWGSSDYEQLEALQVEVNKSLSQITLWKDKASRLKIINPQDSGVNNSELTNYPGILNPSSALVAQGIKYMDPPTPPTDLVNTLNIYKELFFLVAGTFDLEQAQTPGREVIAYKAIAALIERANTMLKGKIRNYSKMIRERGRMYLSHVMNWYTEERWVSYESEGEKMTAAIRGPDLIVPAKLAVVSGSTMPVSKVQIREEAIELFKLNAIDIQELLNRMDWPDRKNVVKRMNAGPMGMLIERLGEIGAPEQVLELMHEVSQMDEKEFKMALHYEDIPPFMAVVQNQEGGDPMQELEMGEKEINIQKTQAEIQKIQLESALLEAKIATEQVDQQVKMSGVQFDQENLKIKKAELVSEMGNQQHAQKMDKANFVSGMAEKQSKDEVERKKVDVAEKAAVSNAKQKGTPPYREKGAKSNNKGKK
jgi:hypothetical protein